MSRVLTLIGGVVAVGAAFATAGWKPVAVAQSGDSSRRGRVEFRHAAPASADVAATVPDAPPAPTGIPDQPPQTAPTPPAATQPEAPTPPATTPEAAAPPFEPDIVSVTDVKLAVVEHAELPPFKIAGSVRLHIDPEGLIFWVTSSNRTEMNGQTHVKRNLGGYQDNPLLIVPDEFTNWQYVKDTLVTADSVGTEGVYLGVATNENKTTLRVIRIYPSAPSDQAGESDFVIHVEEGDGGPAVSVNGTEIESFPADLAEAWNTWKRDHPALEVSLDVPSPVVVDAHRFCPTGYVAQVIDVLRGLGIPKERFVGATDFGGRQRK